MDRALIVLAALILNACLAGRRWYMPPALGQLYALPGKILRDLERKLNREHRSDKEREGRGVIVVTIAAITSLILGAIAKWLFSGVPLFEVLLVAPCLSVRETWDIAAQIRKNLAAGDVVKARSALEGTHWRHHALLDESGMARAGIETLAVQLAVKIVAPACWYALFGLPGLFLCKSITLMEDTLRTDDFFGKAAVFAQEVVCYVPAMLASFFWLAATWLLPSGNARAAAAKVGSGLSGCTPNTLALLTAATSLKLALGGPVSIYAKGVWIGDGAPKATSADMGRGQYLFVVSQLFLFVFFGLFI